MIAVPAHAASTALPNALSTTRQISGMAALGKVALALLVIIAMIFVCAWLLRRFGSGHGASGQQLKMVGARAVGHKERVVLLDVEGTRLVLGVAPGRVSKLHAYPTPETEAPPPAATDMSRPFAERFANALRHHIKGG